MQTNQPRSFEQALRERLIATGASQLEIALETGVAQTSVSRFLRGTVSLRVSTFQALLGFAQRYEELKRCGLVTVKKPGSTGAPRGLRGRRAS